jgi:Domain of unknown function (DUF4288)
MWYAASLLFESVHNGRSQPDALWEEKIVLLQAGSEEEARRQADQLGKTEEHSYASAEGDQVQWSYRGVERVCPIDAPTLERGTELFSRFLRASEVASLRAPFKKDAPRPVNVN